MEKYIIGAMLLMMGCSSTKEMNENNGEDDSEKLWVVTTLKDIVDDADGEVSLREAIAFARANDKTVTFVKDLTGTIDYADGVIDLGDSDDIKIMADEPITLDAKSASRHFLTKGANLSLDGITLVGGKGPTFNGGGSIWADSGDIVLENCEFKNNETPSIFGGGAVKVGDDATLTIRSSVFSSNLSTQGLAVWSSSSSTVKITDSTFNDHEDDRYGVVYHEGEGDFEISGGEFKNNKINRGALYISTVSGNASIDGVTFEGNEAEYGAAVVFDYSGIETDRDAIELTIKASTFTKNIGIKTGAVDTDDFAKVTVEDSTFVENIVNGDTATGGAIRSRGTLKVVKSTFSKNMALGSARGGAIGAAGLARPTLEIIESTFSENSAGAGGAVFISTGQKLTIDKSTFTDNTAAIDGGALVANSDDATISDSSFTGNKVTEEQSVNGGGAIETSKDLSLVGVTITGNSASRGGGILISVSELTLGAGCLISNNVALRESTNASFGGGVCNNDSDITGSEMVKDNMPSDFCNPARAN